jgi:hypothetical protein
MAAIRVRTGGLDPRSVEFVGVWKVEGIRDR